MYTKLIYKKTAAEKLNARAKVYFSAEMRKEEKKVQDNRPYCESAWDDSLRHENHKIGFSPSLVHSEKFILFLLRNILLKYCKIILHSIKNISFIHAAFQFVSINSKPLCASVCLLAYYSSVLRCSSALAFFYCFLKNIKSISLYVVPLMKARNAKRRKEWRSEVRFPFVSSFMIERMNTKTTYFKILNTNCAEETMKHHDRVREIDAT